MNAKKSTPKQQPSQPPVVDTSRGRAGRPQSLFAGTDETEVAESSADEHVTERFVEAPIDASTESSIEASSTPSSISPTAQTTAAPTSPTAVAGVRFDVAGSAAAIATVELSRHYGDAVALEPISLHVPPGQRVALVGHNGSGKTTLIRMLTGTLDPTGGSVTVFGHAVGSIEARAALSYLADQPVFYDDLSLIEHLEYVARLHGRVDWTDQAAELMDRFGISHRAEDLPITFSRGLKQKASICLAFIRPFEVLVVDEPFVGLDAPGRAELLAMFNEAHKGGRTLLVATHELHTVAASDRLLALADGVLIHDGSPDVDVDALVDGVAAST